MKTKDNGKKSNENEKMASDTWAGAPAGAWVLELANYAVPNASVGELVVLGGALGAHLPKDATAGEKGACDRMVRTVTLSDRALDHNEQLEAAAKKNIGGRLRVVRFATAVMEMLEVQARSPEPTIAAEATKLKDETFGVDFDPVRLDGRKLLRRLRKLKEKLDADPALRQRLERCVPAAQLEALFRELAGFGARWQRDEGDEAETTPALNLTAVKKALRTHIGEYVANVLASVDSGRPDTVRRALTALKVLVELRRDLAARRSRRSLAALGVEEEETEVVEETEEDETEAAPAKPTPPSTKPPATTTPPPVAETDDG